MTYKTCLVPKCKSTSIKTPKKLFIYVTHNEKLRNIWLKLARRANDVSKESKLYICEDHFDLPNDMVNYMEYHVMGRVSQVKLKPGCAPSKFECQGDKRKRIWGPERPNKKQGMIINKKCFNETSISREQVPPNSLIDCTDGTSDFQTNEEFCGMEDTQPSASKHTTDLTSDSDKFCIVPLCKSSTRDTPKKLFFAVPTDGHLKLKWCEAMNEFDVTASAIYSISNRHCCEDHFDPRPCSSCLSYGRLLAPLGDLTDIYRTLMPGVENLSDVEVCWECRGALRKCASFQQQAARACDVLALTRKGKLAKITDNSCSLSALEKVNVAIVSIDSEVIQADKLMAVNVKTNFQNDKRDPLDLVVKSDAMNANTKTNSKKQKGKNIVEHTDAISVKTEVPAMELEEPLCETLDIKIEEEDPLENEWEKNNLIHSYEEIKTPNEQKKETTKNKQKKRNKLESDK